MGIKNLYKLIKTKYAPITVTMSDYSGKTIGIDASPVLYASLLSGANLSYEGRPVSHINVLFYKCIDMLEAGIIPIFVFDGRAGTIKDKCLSDRKAARKVTITGEMISECQQLLALLGIQFVQAEGEADALLAEMCRAGLIYAVATDDSDLLAFGATRLWRMNSGHEYNLADICAAFNITGDQFIDICVLLGGDYGNPFHGIGVVRAIEIIKRHGSLSNYAKQNNASNWQNIRNEFTQSVIVPHISHTNADYPAAANFLIDLYGHRPDRVKSALARIQIV